MSQEFLTHLGTEESNHIKLEKKQPANLNLILIKGVSLLEFTSQNVIIWVAQT